MAEDYQNLYTGVEIIKDTTGGLVSLGTAVRHGQERKTKVTNNFTGLMNVAESPRLLQLCEQLARQLPPKQPNEVILGMERSGIIMSGFLALARSSRFNWSTTDQLGQLETVFSFEEGHRGKKHYFHGIKPGDTAIIIEDEVTSGNGVAGLAIALKAYGVQVLAIACVLETVNFDGRKRIAEATGLELQSLIQIKLTKST